MMNLVHDIDALHYITGIRVTEVFSHCATMRHDVAVEDSSTVMFRGSRNELGSISASVAVRGHQDDTMRIWGTNGHLSIRGDTVEFFSTKPTAEFEREQWHRHKVSDGSANAARKLCLIDFVDDIRHGVETSLDDRGKRAVAVVCAAYESAANGMAVSIPDSSGGKEAHS